jgi:hypothetical protein
VQRLIGCFNHRPYSSFCALTRIAVVGIVQGLVSGTSCIRIGGGDGTTKCRYSEPSSSHGCNTCWHWTQFPGTPRRVGTVVDAPEVCKWRRRHVLTWLYPMPVGTVWRRSYCLAFFIKKTMDARLRLLLAARNSRISSIILECRADKSERSVKRR